MSENNLSDQEISIIDLIKARKKSMTFNQIKSILKIRENEKLNESLKNLELNKVLYVNDYNEYQLFDKCQNINVGVVKVNKKGKIFVSTKKESIYIDENDLNGAIKGDIVLVKKKEVNKDNSSKGKIKRIIERGKNQIIFDYIDKKFVPYNWPCKMDINVLETPNLVDGTRVIIDISLEKTNNKYNGQIVSILGHKDDPEIDVKTIISNNGIIIDFKEETINEANKINSYVTDNEIQNRIKNGGLDLRNEIIFTIDGDNTKDIDDAVSIKKKENGNYILGVHIADVSYYVKENSNLDIEARMRSTSIYPYNYVIPMLPHKLSNGICSLNPNVDRLALSCIMEIDLEGNIIDYKIVDTIINSKMKMSYKKINDIFDSNIMYEEYKPYINDLKTMLELSEILNKRKIKRGYINFGDNDIEFDDQKGTPISINKRVRGKAEKMIENFMLAANETTSSFYYFLGMPGIYRNHPCPDIDSIKSILDLIGIHIHISNNSNTSKSLQNIINKIKCYDSSDIYRELLLQSMKRAYYSPQNIGHFGLALENYTHFTSPIRRYPDLETHRVIRKIRDNILNIDTKKLYKTLTDICINSSYKERLADKVEKEVNQYKMAEYMENHINETFTCYIYYISSHGISLKTENGIIGKINTNTIESLGFKYNDNNRTYINKQDNTILYIGDKISTTLKYANKEQNKIEFDYNNKIKDEISKRKIKTKKILYR